jgi:protein-disulfide isomerase
MNPCKNPVVSKKRLILIWWSFILTLPISSLPTSLFAKTSIEITERCVGGDAHAPIKIEVFSCYQCPPCRDFYLDTVRPLLKEYGPKNKVCLIYYEFPLEIHNYAREAAQYGQAARSLGQDQWQRVSEALYEHLYKWREDRDIVGVISSVLSYEEMEKLKQLVKDPSIDEAVERDIEEGQRRHITGTPTFFVHANGNVKRVVGKISFPILKDYLEGLLK